MIIHDELGNPHNVDPFDVVSAQRSLSQINALYDIVGMGRLVSEFSMDQFTTITTDMMVSDQFKDNGPSRWIRPTLMTSREQRSDRALYYTDDGIRIELFSDTHRSLQSKIQACEDYCAQYGTTFPT